MAFSASGSEPIPAGSLDLDVGGLSIPFTPGQVGCAVRLPSAEAPFVTASVQGSPSSTGFSVAFSAPVPSGGYILDWWASGGEASAVDSSSLAVGYEELVGIVARFLGYGLPLTEAQAAEVDSCIQAGVRNFYFPPRAEGVDGSYEWSFLRMGCSLQTSAGIDTYRMADGFGKVRGDIYFGGGDIALRPVAVIPVGALLSMCRTGVAGAPRYAAFRFRQAFGSTGQYAEMLLFPKPDRAYSLEFAGEADAGRISASKPFPLGGASFAELLTESCLAVAEQRENDEAGIHTQNFNNLLATMTERDRGRSGAEYGRIGDAPDFVPPPGVARRTAGGLAITYNGVTQ